MERKTQDHDDAATDRSNSIRSADDTGMISGEMLITQAELEHPEVFEVDKD